MTPDDWNTFFMLLDQAGQQPTVINDAHGKVTPAAAGLPASSGRTTVLNQTARAEDANGKMGKALSDLEAWGKEHSGAGTPPGGSVEVPGTIPGGTPPPAAGTQVPSEVTTFVPNASSTDSRKVMDNMPQGVVHTIAGSGAKKVSWTIGSGGYPCYLSFDPTFPNDPALTTGSTGGTPWLNAPAKAQWTAYLFFTADPGRVQKATVDIYAV